MKDANPRMRIQAIRASETLYKAGDKSFADDYRALTKDADPNVVIQAMLTLNLFKLPDLRRRRQGGAGGEQGEGRRAHRRPPARAAGGRRRRRRRPRRRRSRPSEQKLLQQGSDVFDAVCFTCHGADGRGAPLAGAPPGTTMAPPLAGSPRVQGHRDYVIKVLLQRPDRPLDGKTYSRSHGADGRQHRRVDRRRSRRTSATASATPAAW